MRARVTLLVDGHLCRVVRTPDAGKRDCPILEVEAPEGMEFSGGETSLVAHTEADLAAIADGEHLSEIAS